MPIYETYSRRKREAAGGAPDVYQYDELPRSLRVQITHILTSAIGHYDDRRDGPVGYPRAKTYPNNNEAWAEIQGILCREYGRFYLSANNRDPEADCITFLMEAKDVDQVLDVVEVCFTYVDKIVREIPDYRRADYSITQGPDDAMEELNQRFRQAGVGYQFEGGRIVRVDSALVHAEVVRPALRLLSAPGFEGPDREFRDAHAHYRAGEYKDAVTDANNAFESTLKAICDIKGWEYKRGARASDLLKVVRANGLLPDYLDQSFDQLVATLKSGLPEVRNNAGAHGDGAVPKETPGYIAAYALHIAAANIVLLVTALVDD